MIIKLTTLTNKTPEEGISEIFQRVVNDLEKNSGKIISDALLWTTRNHFKTIYPGSDNFNPEKVQKNKELETGNTGGIDIYTKGINRAYHDVNIRPVKRKCLTIPMHVTAYGKKASDFDDLFIVKKKNGASFLAQNDGKKVTMMFYLAKSAFQKQDSSIMPSDETYRDNIASRLQAYIYQTR